MKENEIRGLTAEEAEQSRLRWGDNVITPPKRESAWRLLADKFRDPVMKVLIAAAVVSFAMSAIEGEYAETIGIVCAIVLATGVGFWFEYDAMKRFDELNKVNDEMAVKVVRDGRVGMVPLSDVVVGDAVVVETGDAVPADGKLVEAVSLKIDESTLTGEPEVDKSAEESGFDPEATYPSNMLMRGTNVSDGYGVMIVTAVGDGTEFGHVARQATVESGEETPLGRQLARLSSLIGKAGVTLAVAIFAVLVAKGLIGGEFASEGWIHIARRLLGYFMVAVVVLVMAVPEGLPMSITLSLALNMRRMLRTGNLVRRMHASETMGAVTVICTDKTGTLTENRMTVQRMEIYGGDEESLCDMVAMNSTASLDGGGRVVGNPTEGALLLWMKSVGCDYAIVRDAGRIVDRMTFTTERKFMATLVRCERGNALYVKGAPEIVRAMCIADGRDAEVEGALRGFQEQAMRTLGFAVAETEAASCQEALAAGGLRFVAVAAIADPLREDVPNAVARCLGAGIDIKIVTGDTPATAREIARRIGLWNDAADSGENCITGAEFAAMSDEQLVPRLKSLKVISRARPLDKQRLVRLLQQAGEVVAVTGDGTNDAPALNFAHVGLAMGSGTSVAREAGDITLLDDSFGSIATAVMWGRSLYKNIQRFLLFQLTINVAAIAVVFLGSIVGHELPLTVTQMLWINLIMDTFAAMALASLPPDESVMLDKPRRRDEFIITRPLARSIVVTGIVFAAGLLGLLAIWGTAVTEYRLSVFFTLFVMLQFWNLFNARVFGINRSALHGLRGCKGFRLVLLLIFAGQVLIVTFGGEVFRTEPLALHDWVLITLASSAVLWAGEALRFAGRMNKRKK